MKISTRGRYALRVMLDLASQDAEQLVPLKDVAARQGITLKYMEQIITLLKKQDIWKAAEAAGEDTDWQNRRKSILLAIFFVPQKAVWHRSVALRMKKIHVCVKIFVQHSHFGKAWMKSYAIM